MAFYAMSVFSDQAMSAPEGLVIVSSSFELHFFFPYGEIERNVRNQRKITQKCMC